MRELLAIVLRREGYEVLLAENGRAAIDTLEREPIDLLISDIKMPDMSGVDVLRAAKQIDQDILGIMITAFASTETAVEAMRLGACDYLSKPFDIDLLKMKVREKIENRQLRQENVLLKRTLGLSHQFSNIIGRSEAMLDVFKMIETVARTNSTILLTGESGTGKGLVAQAVHFHSLRRDKPMVSLNCGAMPETLLESELFGHMRGAFTGADVEQEGAARGRGEGHDLPRRDRRDERRHAGQAAARAAGAPVPPRRRPRGAAGRHPRDRGHQPGSRQGGRRGAVPRGPVLPDQRHPDRAAAAARAPRGHPAARRALPGEVRRADGEADHRHLARARWSCSCGTTGRATSASSRTSSSAPWRSKRRRPSCPRACRRRSAAAPPRNGAAAGESLPDAGFDLEAHVKEIERGYIAQALERAGGVQVKAAELLGMSFRSFRYYVKKYNLR